MRKTIPIALALVFLLGGFAAAEEGVSPPRRIAATAVVDSGQGTRRMPVTFVAYRFTPVAQARQLAGVLERGGQSALAATLRGRRDGEVHLGAMTLPIALVVAEPTEDGGFRYLFLTPRRIQVREQQFGEDSLDYPFGVLELQIDDRGHGEGELHVAARVLVDGSGHVAYEDYDGMDGYLEDVRILPNHPLGD